MTLISHMTSTLSKPAHFALVRDASGTRDRGQEYCSNLDNPVAPGPEPTTE